MVQIFVPSAFGAGGPDSHLGYFFADEPYPYLGHFERWPDFVFRPFRGMCAKSVLRAPSGTAGTFERWPKIARGVFLKI